MLIALGSNAYEHKGGHSRGLGIIRLTGGMIDGVEVIHCTLRIVVAFRPAAREMMVRVGSSGVLRVGLDMVHFLR